MNCEEINKYNVKVKILKANNEQMFHPPYNKKNSCDGSVMTSVNAGYSIDGFGGTGVNKDFKNILKASVEKCGSMSYLDFHKQVIENTTGRCEFEILDQPSHKNLHCTAVFHDHLANQSKVNDDDHTGSVIIDVFKDEYLPYGNQENRAMTYVYSPHIRDFKYNGVPNIKAFLEAVKKTATNLIVATENLNDYYIYAKSDLQISVIRMSSFSSGLFSEGVSDDLVHEAIHEGMIDGLEKTKNRRTIKLIQYPVDMRNKYC